MSSANVTPTPTDVVMNDALATAIKGATHPDLIREAVQNELEKQVAATASQKEADDKAAADAAKVAADAAAAASAPKTLTRVENIGGVDIEFSGASEAELDRAVINAFKVASIVRPTTEAAPTTAAVDPAIAAKAAADAATARAAANADLELKWKRGEISATQYIEQSGAVKDYLAQQGIPVEALREQVEQTRGQKEVQSWADATTQFLKGSDWPGGERNRELLGYKLGELGLTDATDKVAALTQAYASLKASNMIFKDDLAAPVIPAVVPPAAVVPAAAAVVVPPAAAPAAPAQTAPRSSGVFGASSGVGGAPTTGAAPANSPIPIPADATPAEIMAVYKEALLREGKDPNAEFMRQFAQRR